MYNNSYRYNSEIDRMHFEELGIYDVIEQMIKNKKSEYQNDIFNRRISFVLTKRHIKDEFGSGYIETITLNEISINQTIFEPKYNRKYSLKERLRILFKGSDE